MNCPKCGAETTEGQNYCGGCGAQLQNACPGCGTINPPFFKYCGQCGRNLVDTGSLLLDRAGLILAADKKALKILGQADGKVTGKPFALFVKVDELVVFYSHWNELMRSSKRQSVEIELVPSAKAAHAQIEMGLLRGKGGAAARIHLALSDVTDVRRAMQDSQTLQDLVALIFSWVDAFDPGGKSGRDQTVAGVLETIGLFAGGQYAFI
ncbi:MAG TPA: zinc ribbon domain-containing protein, partial [Desulfosarcina sp.]|nr:zinc ribbon domain-containing protein [Desulfosarcina sp.]